jgi:hypothetical protein
MDLGLVRWGLGISRDLHTHTRTLDSKHECCRADYSESENGGLWRLLMQQRERTAQSWDDDDVHHPRQGNSRGEFKPGR